MALRHLRMWNPPGRRRSGARFPGYASSAGSRKKKATPKKKASSGSSSPTRRKKTVAKPAKKTLKKTANGRYMYGGKFISATRAKQIRAARRAAAARKKPATKKATTRKAKPKTAPKRKRRVSSNPSTTKRRSTTVARKKSRTTKRRAAPKRRTTARRNPSGRKKLTAAHRRKISASLKRRYRGAKSNPRGYKKTTTRKYHRKGVSRPAPRKARSRSYVARHTYKNRKGKAYYRYSLWRPAKKNDWMANLKSAVSTALPVFGGLMVSRVGGAMLQKYVFSKNDSLKAHGHLLAPAALLLASAVLGPKLKLSPKLYNGLAMGAVMGLADAVVQKYVAPALMKADAGETSQLIGKAI